MKLPSPVTRHTFRGCDFFLKRDDLIDEDFSGNKARKFAYFLDHEFPGICKVYAYGSPQSNAMYSLSVLAKQKGWAFHYFVDHVASFLQNNPHGNYHYALENGMILHQKPFPKNVEKDVLVVHEGGRQKEAEYGVKQLAKELIDYFGEKEVSVFLPSGTGTTALFLQKHLPYRVYTTPCVGDVDYLKSQFAMLEPDQSRHPTVLQSSRKYHFGKIYLDFFKIWIELKEETGITFDLLYDPKGWIILLEHRNLFRGELCYIHQGGLQGNESMIKRYERKYHEAIKQSG